MAKVFLGIGHGGNDPGAVSYLVEKDVNLTMGLACRDYLVANGVEVKMSRTKDENDVLTDEIKECNEFNPDLAVDIHNNAGKGDGFEIYHSINGGVGKILAQNIEAEVKAIGQNSRGCKTKLNSTGNADYYGFIRQTRCPATIAEGLFVDNATDVQIADTIEEQKAFGVAYAKGILKTLGITPNATKPTVTPAPSPAPVQNGYLVKVTASVLNIRSGAGTNYKVVGSIKDKGVYTIVAEANGQGAKKWGQLKSGEGWISLDYTTKQTSGSVTTKKSVDEVAREILTKPNYGGWGIGAERKNKLIAAGYDYNTVQNRVNQLWLTMRK